MRALGALMCVACATAALGARAAPASTIVFAADHVSVAYGEIYRVDAHGTRVDLSRSPAPDVAPSVSAGGKRVAFVSARGGRVAVYVVGIDGRGLRRVSPFLFRALPTQSLLAAIAWSPDGRRLAVEVDGPEQALYLADLHGRGWRMLSRSIAGPASDPAWSPDGRRLAYTTSYGVIRVVSATGKLEWSTAGLGGTAWSAGGRLAVSANSYTIHVYDPRGRLLSSFGGAAFAWSRGLLASVRDRALEVRRGGTGTPLLHVRLSRYPLATVQWLAPGRVRVPAGDGWVGYDVDHRRPWRLAGAAAAFSSVVSRGEVVTSGYTGTSVVLALSRLGQGSTRTLAVAPGCGDDEPFQDVQLVPGRRSVVYQSGCLVPSADLYAVAPDGTGLRQLTATPADETQPSLSPDGSRVVYVQQASADRCQGCPQSLWTVAAAGGTPLQLTLPSADSDTPFAETPSFSPDGTQVACAQSGANAPSTLVVVPAGGGAVRSLGVVGRVPAWGPHGIAFVDDAPPAPRIDVLDPATRAVSTVATLTGHDFGALAWSLDGRLAYLEYDRAGRASIAIAGSSAQPIPLAPLLPPGSRVAGLAWSPDGTRFAFTATDANLVGEVWTIGVDGTGLARVTTAIGAVGALDWR